MTRCCLISVLAFGILACSSEEVRPVWIADVEPASSPAGGMIRLIGRGFGEPAQSLGIQGPVIYRGTNAITVGGIEAGVIIRQDRRLELRIPPLEPGPHFVVVWTDGVASNAYPITVISTTR